MTSAAYPAAVRKYDRVSVVLHWSIAALIVANGVLAMMIDTWPREQRPPIVNLHAVLGLAVLALAVWRIANRLKNPAPPLPPGPVWMEKAAKAGHGLLYLGTLLIPCPAPRRCCRAAWGSILAFSGSPRLSRVRIARSSDL
ncbi:MAG: cytochrome b/b6 domain-containing protein [Rhodoblastus sp.]|nr:MAG: cytochrome b/b6 domain-containing protein [Rhodoblastus sp.]